MRPMRWGDVSEDVYKRQEHYSVDSCYDGQEALDYLASAEYDAAVLDIMMPAVDGLTRCV